MKKDHINRKTMLIRLLTLGGLAVSGIFSGTAADAPIPAGMYVCRSPLLAFDFWNSLLHTSNDLKIKLTPNIVAQIAAGQNCIRVVSDDLRPIKSGWGGALAMVDGDKTPVLPFFSQPDTFGWVHPDYYIKYVNDQRLRRARQNSHAAQN